MVGRSRAYDSNAALAPRWITASIPSAARARLAGLVKIGGHDLGGQAGQESATDRPPHGQPGSHAGLRQLPGNLVADEAGRAGYEDSHDSARRATARSMPPKIRPCSG